MGACPIHVQMKMKAYFEALPEKFAQDIALENIAI